MGLYDLGWQHSQPDFSAGQIIACLNMAAISFLSRAFRHIRHIGLLSSFLQYFSKRTGK